MATKKKKEEALRKEFLVRLLDKETADLISKSLEKGLYPNRNKLINECIKGWLSRVNEKANPEQTLKEILAKESVTFGNRFFGKLDEIRKLLMMLLTIMTYDDKAIGYLISQLDHILEMQSAIPNLPAEAVQLGNFDKLPERLEKGKVKSLSDLLGDNSD